MAWMRGRTVVRGFVLPIVIVCLAAVAGPVAPAGGLVIDDQAPADSGPSIHNMTMTASPGAGLPGTSALDASTVDVASLPLFPEEGAVAAPLRSSPLRSSPLRSSPLRSSPLRSSPLRSSPLRSSPLRSSPLRSSFLPAMPLSTVPLLVEGGWATVLEGTQYDGVTLGSVTLQQVLALDPAPQKVADLTLFDVDLAATPLSKSSIQAFLLTGATLATLSDTSVCGAFTGFACSDHGLTDATSTLLDLEWAGAPMSQVSFVQHGTIGDSDFTAALIAGYDILAVDLHATALGSIPASSLPEVVDCAAYTCGEGTSLATAVDDHLTGITAIKAGATLGQVLARTDLFTVRNLRLGSLVRSVVDPAELDFAKLTLRPLLLGTEIDATSTRLVRYTAQATVDCVDSENVFFNFALPEGFRYVAGSAEKSRDGGAPTPADPYTPPILVDSIRMQATADGPTGEVVRFLLGDGFTCFENHDEGGVESETITVSFSALPGVTLGAHTAAFGVSTFTSGESGRSTNEVLRHTASFSVGDDFEPNDTPGDATAVTPGTLYLSHISHGDDVDYFKLPTGLPEGTRISAVLSHLPGDFDLFLEGPTATAPNAAPLRSSPLRSSPLNSSPLEDTGIGDLNGDALSPEALQDVPVTGALSVSDKRSTESELVSVIVRESNAATPHVLAVTHHLGSTSREPYMLQVFVDEPPQLTCATGFSLANGTRGTLPKLTGLNPDTKTLFVVNRQRMEAAFGATETATALTALDGLAARPEVTGLVVPVDGDASVVQEYATWDTKRCSVDEANDVGRAITGVLHQYATALPKLQYVVTVGDDDIIPFTRVFDGATLSNQQDYYENVVFDGVDNPISAAAAYGMVLSDNAYTDRDTVDFLDRQLLTPDYVGARLVETPAEITAVIESYTTKPYVDVTAPLTTGYDFITDGATAVNAELGANGATLINEQWTADQLATALTGKTVASVNAHFDHSNLLPASGNASQSATPDLFSTATLLTAGLPAGALLFTIGCEAGLNVPGRAWATATGADTERLLDWAQALAQLKALGFFANTGYGYGDDTVVAYSERFIELFAERLDGTMTIGQAVLSARDAYTREMAVDVYHEKVLNEATFYGLPFAVVGANGAEAPITADTATGAPLPVDPTYGVQAATFNVTPTLSPVTAGGATYYTVPGEQTATALYRPVMPATDITLPPTPAGTVQGDVLITGLSSGAATAIATPAFVTPTSDHTGFNPEFTATDVAFPVSLWSNAPEGGIRLYPAQLRSTAATGATAATAFTQETLTAITGKVFYPTGDPSTMVRPTIAGATAVDFDGTTTFQVKATGAEKVLLLYRNPDSATWSSVELTDLATGVTSAPTSEPTILLAASSAATPEPGTFTATVPGSTVEYFVQAVRDGLVGSARGKGLNLRPVQAGSNGLSVIVDGEGNNGWVKQSPTPKARVTGSAGVVFEASVNGGPFQPVGSAGLALTTTGLNVIEARGSDGSSGTEYVLVDVSPPTVDVVTPTEGGHVSEATEASFTCSDVGSGIQTCQALDPVTLETTDGTHEFRVKAVDKAGNETVVTVQYEGGYIFEGFFEPVDEDPDVWNVVQAGSTVPMKFRVREGDGTAVSDLAVVQQPTSKQVQCEPGDTSVISPDLLDASTTSGLRYEPGNEQFIFNWKLNKLWGGQCREFTLTLDDGSVHTALFQIKK